jgi:hypothetical protein
MNPTDLKALRDSIIQTALAKIAPKPKAPAKLQVSKAPAPRGHSPDELTLKPLVRAALTRVQTCPLCGRTDDLTIETGLWFRSGKYGRTFKPHGSMDEFLALPLEITRLDPIDRECPSCLAAEATIDQAINQTAWRQTCLFH